MRLSLCLRFHCHSRCEVCNLCPWLSVIPPSRRVTGVFNANEKETHRTETNKEEGLLSTAVSRTCHSSIYTSKKLVTTLLPVILRRAYWLLATRQTLPEWLNYKSIIMNYLREKKRYNTKGVFCTSLFQLNAIYRPAVFMYTSIIFSFLCILSWTPGSVISSN